MAIVTIKQYKKIKKEAVSLNTIMAVRDSKETTAAYMRDWRKNQIKKKREAWITAAEMRRGDSKSIEIAYVYRDTLREASVLHQSLLKRTTPVRII